MARLLAPSLLRRLGGIGFLCVSVSGATGWRSGASVVVLQDTASWLIQEYTKVRGATPPVITRIERGMSWGGRGLDSALVVLGSGQTSLIVEMRTGGVPSGTLLAEKMFDARRGREIIRIPSEVLPPCAGRGCNLDLIGAVTVCDESTCHQARPLVVKTRSVDSTGCLMGMAANLPNDSAVRVYLREKLGKAAAVALLDRVAEPPQAITYSQVRGLAPTLIPSDLALRSPLWVADSMGWNLRTFQVTPIFGSGGVLPRSVRLRNDWRSYKYLGDTLQPLAEGGPDEWAPRVVGDSLLLKGPELRIEDSASWCALANGDMWQRRWDRWLVMPDSTLDLQTALAHGAPMLENGKAWPIENDTLLVGGRRLALATFLELGTTTVLRSPARHGGEWNVQGRNLVIELPAPASLQVTDPSGRILLETSVPGGRSVVALPRRIRGLLLVRAGGTTLPVVLP